MPPSEIVVNWDEVKRRLSTTERMLAEDFKPSRQAQALILAERAHALARVPLDDENEETREMLEFSIAGECFAFEAAWVHEIVVLKELSPLPCTPSFVQGVVNLRGRIVSAVDLRRFWGGQEESIVDFHRVIVLRGWNMEIGVLADRVDGVAPLKPKEIIRNTPAYPAGVALEHVLGVVAGKTTLLDAEALLRDRRMIVDQEIQA